MNTWKQIENIPYVEYELLEGCTDKGISTESCCVSTVAIVD